MIFSKKRNQYPSHFNIEDLLFNPIRFDFQRKTLLHKPMLLLFSASLVSLSTLLPLEIAGVRFSRSSNQRSLLSTKMTATPQDDNKSEVSPWDSIVDDYESRVEPFTLSFVEEMLEPFVNSASSETTRTSPLRLLDVGCGTGAATLHARKHGFHVTATDVSPVMVQRLRTRHEELYGNNDMLEAVAANGQELPMSFTNKFDFAVGAFSVIFFPNVPKGLEEMYRCLVPGRGRMVLSAWGNAQETPAFRVFPDAFQAVAPRLLESSKPKRIVGSPQALKALLEDAGFENVQIAGPIKRLLKVSSAEAYYDRFALGSPNTMNTISKMTEDEVKQLKAKVIELVESRGGGRPDGSIEIPSMAYFAYGTKPATTLEEQS